MKQIKRILTIVLAAMMMTSLCFAQESAQDQPESVSVTTLSELTGSARTNALADLSVLRQEAPMIAAYGLGSEDVTITTYEAVAEENGLVHQTTFYDLSGSTRASGTYGGGYTTRYWKSGRNLFNIYMYASFDVTTGCVNGNRSQSKIWASDTNVTLDNISINFYNENTAASYASGSCTYNYQNKYNGSFNGTVSCTDSGVVKGGDTTVQF